MLRHAKVGCVENVRLNGIAERFECFDYLPPRSTVIRAGQSVDILENEDFGLNYFKNLAIRGEEAAAWI